MILLKKYMIIYIWARETRTPYELRLSSISGILSYTFLDNTRGMIFFLFGEFIEILEEILEEIRRILGLKIRYL